MENLGNLYERFKKDVEYFLDLFNLEPEELITKEFLDPEFDH